MSRRHKIQKVLDATSQEVAMLGMVEKRELFLTLRQAEVEIAQGLADWLKLHPDGAARFTAQHLRNALLNTRAGLQTLRSMHPRMAGMLESLRGGAGNLAIRHVEGQLLQFQSLFDGAIKPPNIRVASILARGNRLLIKKHRRSARRYAGDMTQHIKRQLSVGVIKGESFDAMTGRLIRLGPPRRINDVLEVSDKMARGLMQLPRSSMARIVRTEAINAYNIAHLETIDDLASDDSTMMKRWDSSLDRRGCIICHDLDGEIRKPNEQFTGGFDHPPAHPFCRCTLVPWSEEWKHDSLQSTGTEAIDAPDPKPMIDRREERVAAK